MCRMTYRIKMYQNIPTVNLFVKIFLLAYVFTNNKVNKSMTYLNNQLYILVCLYLIFLACVMDF